MLNNSDTENSAAWWLTVKEKKIGELTNGNLDPQSEFWSEFNLTIFDTKYSLLMTEAEYWYASQIVLQEKDNAHVKTEDYLVAIREDNKVAIRILPG